MILGQTKGKLGNGKGPVVPLPNILIYIIYTHWTQPKVTSGDDDVLFGH